MAIIKFFKITNMNFLYEFYGYFLHGTGSAIYARDLTKALNQAGLNVVLFSQESNPEEFDFITEAYQVRSGVLRKLFTRDTSLRGMTIHVRPDLKGILPVYVYDSYPGYRKVIELKHIDLKTLESFGARIREAVELFEASTGIEPSGYLTHHLSPLPALIEPIRKEGKEHYAVYHGSDLNFAIRRNRILEKQFMNVLPDISGIITLTEHGKSEVETFIGASNGPKIEVVPPGIDTEKFNPIEKEDALKQFIKKFKTVSQDEALSNARLKIIEAIYDSDRDGALSLLFQELEKIEAARMADPLLPDILQRHADTPLIIFAGKYLWTKGAAALLLAMPFVWHRFPKARLLLVGFGASRGILEKTRSSLSAREYRVAAHLIAEHKSIDPGSGEDVMFDAPVSFAAGLARGNVYPDFPVDNFMQNIFFAGYLDHERLAPLLSLGDVFVAPSLFRESFGLVLLEAASAGVLPVASCHSGFRDILLKLKNRLGSKYEFICVDLNENFVQNLGEALTEALSMKVDRDLLYEFVRDNFSWEKTARKVQSLFMNPRTG